MMGFNSEIMELKNSLAKKKKNNGAKKCPNEDNNLEIVKQLLMWHTDWSDQSQIQTPRKGTTSCNIKFLRVEKLIVLFFFLPNVIKKVKIYLKLKKKKKRKRARGNGFFVPKTCHLRLLSLTHTSCLLLLDFCAHSCLFLAHLCSFHVHYTLLSYNIYDYMQVCSLRIIVDIQISSIAHLDLFLSIDVY